MNESRDDTEEQNDSTKAVYSDQEVKEEDLDNSDDIPEINSKLTLREETEPRNGNHRESTAARKQSSVSSKPIQQQQQRKPAEIKPVYIGDQKLRSKLKFEVVTAKVVEEQVRSDWSININTDL